MTRSILIFIILLVAGLNGYSQPPAGQKAFDAARNFLNKEAENGLSVSSVQKLFNGEADMPETWLVRLHPAGFIVFTCLDEKTFPVAYSFEQNFANDDAFEKSISLALIKEAVLIQKEDVAHPEISRNTKNVNVLYGPYVHTMWGQVNCRDEDGKLINVSNIFTPNHYAPGCVSVSQATVMHHYRWPPKGVGTYTYTDNSGSSRGTYTAPCGDTEYRWDLMLERYRSKKSTVEQREAEGELVFHTAVTLRMDFEANGSTSNVNRIPTSLANHFRFTALYRSRSSTTFFSLLDSNMVYKKPAVLAVENSSGGGHSVVCDGLKIDEDGNYFYHLNMGWWGTSNGWYKIRGSFDAGGYNTIIGAAMNILPEPMIIPPVIDADSIEFDLTWRYPQKAEPEAFQVQKRVNNGNWITITDDITDTVLHLLIDPEKEYDFRVRAKTNGKWYQNSWSTVESLKRTYVGIGENSENDRNCYPNPFNNRLFINPDAPAIVSVTVYNVTGKVIENLTGIFDKKIELNTTGWKKGFYLVSVQTVNGHNFVFKAIKN